MGILDHYSSTLKPKCNSDYDKYDYTTEDYSTDYNYKPIKISDLTEERLGYVTFLDAFMEGFKNHLDNLKIKIDDAIRVDSSDYFSKTIIEKIPLESISGKMKDDFSEQYNALNSKIGEYNNEISSIIDEFKKLNDNNTQRKTYEKQKK